MLHMTQDSSPGKDRGWALRGCIERSRDNAGHSELQRAAGCRSNTSGREGWLIPEGGWIATLFLDKSRMCPSDSNLYFRHLSLAPETVSSKPKDCALSLSASLLKLPLNTFGADNWGKIISGISEHCWATGIWVPRSCSGLGTPTKDKQNRS